MAMAMAMNRIAIRVTSDELALFMVVVIVRLLLLNESIRVEIVGK
jgi:hypothetical protein